MVVFRQRTSLHDEFAYYLQDILGNLFGVLLALLYVWLLWTLRPFGKPPELVWVPIGILVATLVLVHRLRQISTPLAMLILVWGLFFCIATAGIVYANVNILLFLIAPLVLAMSLLSARVISMIVLSTYASLFFTAWQTQTFIGDSLFLGSFIAFTIVVVGLSTRYLHEVMRVVWNRNAELDHIVDVARERGSELRQMVKQLDESNHRFYQLNQNLEAAIAEARESRRMKQQFAQNITHELRTPLNLIVGFVELMSRSSLHYGEELPYPYLRDLDIVYNNARHLQRLIDDILDMSRIEAAQMSLNPAPVDFSEVLYDAGETIRGLVESKGLFLKVHCVDSLSKVEIDQTRIKQVLFNLINNAVRFTEKGGITVGCTRTTDGILCRVSDTGSGIPLEQQQSIFQEFQQAEDTRQGGTGLGLTISKRFVEMHGGRMWVESTPGQGSHFCFSLPFSQADTLPHLITTDTYAAPHAGIARKTLFILTESQSAANLLARYISTHTVITIGDSARLEQAARLYTPNAILFDMNSTKFVPDDHPLWQEWQDIPIMHTPLAGEAQRKHELTVNAYLMKPVTPEQIRQLMREFGTSIDTVLVVDDNRDFVQYVARTLDHPARRYQVIRAYGGQEGLQLLQMSKPDLILLDLEMDDIGGEEFIDRVRSRPQTRDIPIAVITGYERGVDVQPIHGQFTVTRHSGIPMHEFIRWVHSVLGD